MNALSLIISALSQGMIYAPMALGVFVAFRILNTPDLTIDGSFVAGMCVCAVVAIAGHPYAALACGLLAGALAGAGAALYYLAGNTEFYWSTYQALPAAGFNGIPVALLAVNNPIAVIFTGIFMAMLDIVGQQLTGLTAYNEYITDVIIAVIVYLAAFSLVIKMMIGKIGVKRGKEAGK